MKYTIKKARREGRLQVPTKDTNLLKKEIKFGNYIYDNFHWWRMYPDGRAMVSEEIEDVLNSCESKLIGESDLNSAFYAGRMRVWDSYKDWQKELDSLKSKSGGLK